VPLKPVLDPLGVTLHLGTADVNDAASRTVAITSAQGGPVSLGYNRLVLATGSAQRPLPLPGKVSQVANIDTYAAAEHFDRRLAALLAGLDMPERVTFVIVGAGFTGIELAAEMRSSARAYRCRDGRARVSR
jgi:NADH dehydrogenase